MATNPPCFAFVNFKHRADAEDAMQSVDGKYAIVFFFLALKTQCCFFVN